MPLPLRQLLPLRPLLLLLLFRTTALLLLLITASSSSSSIRDRGSRSRTTTCCCRGRRTRRRTRSPLPFPLPLRRVSLTLKLKLLLDPKRLLLHLAQLLLRGPRCLRRRRPLPRDPRASPPSRPPGLRVVRGSRRRSSRPYRT